MKWKLLAAFCALFAFASAAWTVIEPYPIPESVRSCTSLPVSGLVVCQSTHYIIWTNDGAEWHNYTSFSANFQSLLFVDAGEKDLIQFVDVNSDPCVTSPMSLLCVWELDITSGKLNKRSDVFHPQRASVVSNGKMRVFAILFGAVYGVSVDGGRTWAQHDAPGSCQDYCGFAYSVQQERFLFFGGSSNLYERDFVVFLFRFFPLCICYSGVCSLSLYLSLSLSLSLSLFLFLSCSVLILSVRAGPQAAMR